ncbi:hypothetical protein F4X86_03250 [Candidatus Saccharibacteria bacterium]|nr:hypothetical protein [Candidatus Saccharibacteria bacterium]
MQKAKTKTNPFTYAIITVGLLAVLGIVLFFGLSGQAAGPWYVSKDGNTYTALPEAGYNFGSSSHIVERWKYAVRGDDTCDGSVFTNGGRNSDGNLQLGQDSSGSPTYVVYGSESFAPNEGQLPDFDGKYICFQALLRNGDWVSVGRQMEFTMTPTAVPHFWDEYCVDPEVHPGPMFGPWPDNAHCTENDSRTTYDEPGVEEWSTLAEDLRAVFEELTSYQQRLVEQGCISLDTALESLDIQAEITRIFTSVAEGVAAGEMTSDEVARLVELNDELQYEYATTTSLSYLDALEEAQNTPCD